LFLTFVRSFVRSHPGTSADFVDDSISFGGSFHTNRRPLLDASSDASDEVTMVNTLFQDKLIPMFRHSADGRDGEFLSLLFFFFFFFCWS